MVEPLIEPRLLKRLRVAELKELLEQRGLSTEGIQKELVARLEECRAAEEAAEEGGGGRRVAGGRRHRAAQRRLGEGPLAGGEERRSLRWIRLASGAVRLGALAVLPSSTLPHCGASEAID